MNCTRCGHPDHWHRLDDATNVSPVDPAAKFRCVGYDCEFSGPIPSESERCRCPDYVKLPAAATQEPR